MKRAIVAGLFLCICSFAARRALAVYGFFYTNNAASGPSGAGPSNDFGDWRRDILNEGMDAFGILIIDSEDAAGKYYFQISDPADQGSFPLPPNFFLKVNALNSSAHCTQEYTFQFTTPGNNAGWGGVFNCFDPNTANLVAVEHNVFYRSDHATFADPSHDAGYVTVDCTSGSCTTSSPWNSGLGAITVARTGTGRYDVSFGGLSHDANVANVQVADMCSSGWSGSACAAVVCRPTGTSVTGGNAHVPIVCRSSSMTTTDAAFRVMYTTFGPTFTTEPGSNLVSDGSFAHAFANQKNTLSYTPANNRSLLQGQPGSQATIRNRAGGAYDVTFPGQILNVGDGVQPMQVSVTTVDDNSGWSNCTLMSLTQLQSPLRVVARVQCRSKSGAGVAAPFFIQLTSDGL